MVSIYVLELQNNKYYVGKSNNVYYRIEQHFNGNGSVWTRKFQPLKTIEIIKDCDDYDEDKYTIKYMNKFGIDNVRGGAFVKIELDLDEINVIQKILSSVCDKCYKCGEQGHFAKECKGNDNLLKLQRECLKFMKLTLKEIYLVDVNHNCYYNYNYRNLQNLFLNEMTIRDFQSNSLGDGGNKEFRSKMISRGDIDIYYNDNNFIVYGLISVKDKFKL